MTVEGMPVLRLSLEFAAYACFLKENPQLSMVWWDRDVDEETKEKARDKFTAGKMTCFPVSGPIYAGKFQFSGCVIRAAGRGMTHEEIEVHGGADCLHPAPG